MKKIHTVPFRKGNIAFVEMSVRELADMAPNWAPAQKYMLSYNVDTLAQWDLLVDTLVIGVFDDLGEHWENQIETAVLLKDRKILNAYIKASEEGKNDRKVVVKVVFGVNSTDMLLAAIEHDNKLVSIQRTVTIIRDVLRLDDHSIDLQTVCNYICGDQVDCKSCVEEGAKTFAPLWELGIDGEDVALSLRDIKNLYGKFVSRVQDEVEPFQRLEATGFVKLDAETVFSETVMASFAWALGRLRIEKAATLMEVDEMLDRLDFSNWPKIIIHVRDAQLEIRKTSKKISEDWAYYMAYMFYYAFLERGPAFGNFIKASDLAFEKTIKDKQDHR